MVISNSTSVIIDSPGNGMKPHYGPFHSFGNLIRTSTGTHRQHQLGALRIGSRHTAEYFWTTFRRRMRTVTYLYHQYRGALKTLGQNQ